MTSLCKTLQTELLQVKKNHTLCQTPFVSHLTYLCHFKRNYNYITVREDPRTVTGHFKYQARYTADKSLIICHLLYILF